jgi:hypothetical protein
VLALLLVVEGRRLALLASGAVPPAGCKQTISPPQGARQGPPGGLVAAAVLVLS